MNGYILFPPLCLKKDKDNFDIGGKTFMDSPFAYAFLCQNQSVFLSRSGASGEMQRKSPSSPRILLKGRKYAGMTHPHSHSSFPLISLLENRDTDLGPQTHRVTGRSYEERKQQG